MNKIIAVADSVALALEQIGIDYSDILTLPQDKLEKVKKIIASNQESQKKAAENPENIFDVITQQKKFFKDVFNRDIDIDENMIPECPRGKGWQLVIIPEGVTHKEILDGYAKLKIEITIYGYGGRSLDEVVTDLERDPAKGMQIVWVEGSIEPNRKYANISADKAKEKSIKGVTVRERLLLGLLKYWEKKRHLDVKNYTLCAGSRNVDGNVPNVNFNDGKVKVNWYNTDNYNDNLRLREVVS
ncbi:MAG: hypothetical protein Q8P11_01405 [bacterium]|nr:hypothetical protein [bacterium]